MAKYTYSQVTKFSDVNTELQLLETAVKDSVDRRGTAPNQMEADLDLNSNDILNVTSISADKILLNGESVSVAAGSVNLVDNYLWTGTHSFSVKLLPVDLDTGVIEANIATNVTNIATNTTSLSTIQAEMFFIGGF